MKFRALLSAAAVVGASFSPVMVVPASAQDATTFDSVILTPLTENDVDPQQVCDDVLRPSGQSGFQTEPTGVSDGGWVNSGSPYFDPSNDTGPAGAASGYGTPSSSNVILSNSYFRNGGSPNVWALAQATLTYQQTQQPWNMLQNQTDTITFGCHVWKINGGGQLVQPPGLQTTGNAVINHQTLPAGVGNKITNVPFVITSTPVVALICISPGSKGGKWTGKNGFNSANCAAASAAAGGTIPSGNIPSI